MVEITYPSSFPIFLQEGFPTVTLARIQFPHNGVFCNEMLTIYKTLFWRIDSINWHNFSNLASYQTNHNYSKNLIGYQLPWFQPSRTVKYDSTRHAQVIGQYAPSRARLNCFFFTARKKISEFLVSWFKKGA